VPLSSLEAFFDFDSILRVKTWSVCQVDGDGALRHVFLGGIVLKFYPCAADALGAILGVSAFHFSSGRVVATGLGLV
jgi:hypothetical protein